MSEVEIRVPMGLGAELRQEMAKPGRPERVVFALTGSAALQGRECLLVRRIISPPEEAYVEAAGHGACWQGAFTVQLLNEAVRDRLGILVCHLHNHAGQVRLSRDDIRSGAEQLTRFELVIPYRRHGSVVFGAKSAEAILSGKGPLQPRPVDIRWLGVSVVHWRVRDGRRPLECGGLYDSQALVAGGVGQQFLSNAKVAVIGLSGGGSHVVQQLAHMGIGTITGIDPDRSEARNRSRMVGLGYWDVLLRRRKTDVMRGLVKHINGRIRFIGVPYAIPEPEAVAAVKNADIIVGCLDNLQARADIQALAWRYVIPYVDIGVRIRDRAPGQIEAGEHPIEAIAGDVHTLIPGGFCLWCREYLTQAKLDAETEGRGRPYFQRRSGDAQVITFNGVLASQAAAEVLHLLVGYSPNEDHPLWKKYNGLDGTMEAWTAKKIADCECCSGELAAGDPEWAYS